MSRAITGVAILVVKQIYCTSTLKHGTRAIIAENAVGLCTDRNALFIEAMQNGSYLQDPNYVRSSDNLKTQRTYIW